MTEATLEKTGGTIKLLGGLQIAVGVIALLAPVQTLVAIVWIAGAVLCVVGVAMCFAGLKKGADRDVLITGLLYAIGGVLLLLKPVIGASLVALVVAILFFLRGVMQILGAIALRPREGWEWLLFGGVLALLLGLFLLLHWPLGGMLAVGVFIGIQLIFEGLLLLRFGGDLRAAAQAASEEPEAG